PRPSSTGLPDRRLQRVVDAGLPALARRLEVIDHLAAEPQGGGHLGRRSLRAAELGLGEARVSFGLQAGWQLLDRGCLAKIFLGPEGVVLVLNDTGVVGRKLPQFLQRVSPVSLLSHCPAPCCARAAD